MDRGAAIRLVSLYIPMALLGLLVLWRTPNRRQLTGAGFSFAWMFAALFALHLGAMRTGWWSFQTEGGSLLGLPVDLHLGWAVLWGPAAALAFPSTSLVLVGARAVGIDCVAMPLCEPIVRLGPHWLLGEAIAVMGVLVPAQLLSRWTVDDRRLPIRTGLLVIAFVLIALGILPAAVLSRTGAFSGSGVGHPPWLLPVLAQLVLLFAVPGLSAVLEFVSRGGGTPVPYDPPRRLVVSGPYAYVANPMQMSMAAVIAVWGAVLSSAWVAAGAILVVAYGAGLASWHENGQLISRFGAPWIEYRRSVRAWRPRWRPYVPFPATLYVAETCAPCRGVGAWLRRRSPVGLRIVPAEDHPSRSLSRITYESPDGRCHEQGVAALARSLEHLHLGWAFLGWSLRIPGIRSVVQLLTDAVGGGPRSLTPLMRIDGPS